MKHLFEERNHIEGLLNTRFNFFMAIFAAIIAAILTVKNPNQLRVILFVGSGIELFFAIAIGRAQLKLSIYLKKMRKNLDEAETFGTRVANRNKNPLLSGSRNPIIGKYLPSFVTVLLIVSALFPNRIYTYLNPPEKDKINNRIDSIEERIIQMERETYQTRKTLDSIIDSVKRCEDD